MSKYKTVIDPIALGKLAELGCTVQEVAAYFRCQPKYIEERIAKEPLRTVWETGFARVKISIRRAQLQAAYSGDRTMLKFLGMNILGQSEKGEQEVKQESKWVVELPPPMSAEAWKKAFDPTIIDGSAKEVPDSPADKSPEPKKGKPS